MTRTAQVGAGLAMLMLHAAASAGQAEDRGVAVAGAVSPVVSQQGRLGRSHKTRLDYATVPIDLDIELPPFDHAEAVPAPRTPPRIGIHRKVPPEFRGDLAGRLRWTQLADGTVVTSIKLRSPGAVSVRIGLMAKLPAGGEIRLFDPSDPGRRLPRVAVDDFIGEIGSSTDVAWLPSVEGEVVAMEIVLPSWESTGSLSLILKKIAHRYASVAPSRKGLEQRTENLECPDQQYVDVLCRTASFPSGQENAVGRVLFELPEPGWSGVCSGTLLNDRAPDDFEPYFLTANHCIDSLAVASSAEVHWFYQRAACGSEQRDHRLEVTTGGAELLASSVEQDSTLLRLRGALPNGLFFSGWSTGVVTHPVEVHNISHPAGGVKKYAAGKTTRGVNALIGGSVVRNAYEVEWSEGGIEGGSSGSGLFEGGQLFGVLSGEPLGCGRPAYFGPFRDFFPRIRRWIAASASAEPDLVVDSPSVDDDRLRLGQRFEFSAVVRNRGRSRSAATTLRYYQSQDGTIGSGDAEVGADHVGGLAALDRVAEAISLVAPGDAGNWYYGACVDAVSAEADGDNNCSTGVRVIVYDDDHGDMRRQASRVRLNTTTEGDLEQAGDQDYFRFDVSATGATVLETTGGTDTTGLLEDAAGQRIEFDDDDGTGYNFKIERTLDVGTYYLRVEGYGSYTTGSYALRIGHTRAPRPHLRNLGDFNGDGRDDALLRHENGRWHFYPMDGRTTSAGRGVANLTRNLAWQVAGIGDFNGDGQDDVLLRHEDGRWHYYPMDGRTVLPGRGTASLTPNLAWQVAGIDDFDDDGRDDVLLRHESNGRWHYYAMNGRRPSASGRAGLTTDLAWSVAGVGDFDGDGRADVLLRHEDGRWYFYPMDGRTVLAGRGTVGMTTDLAWQVAGIGDFDGDGRHDVLLRHEDGRWLYYPLNGRTAPSGGGGPDLTADTTIATAAIGDLNGDGRADVLMRGADGRWHYYPMHGPRILAGWGEADLPADPAWTLAVP